VVFSEWILDVLSKVNKNFKKENKNLKKKKFFLDIKKIYFFFFFKPPKEPKTFITLF
jgi:hypothetical protein